MDTLLLFIILNVCNVVLQTIKSIATIKCGKLMAAVINAMTYGLYTIVIVYTMADINLFVKASIVAIANFFGVYAVKSMEERVRKNRLWCVEATIPIDYCNDFADAIEEYQIPHSEIEVKNGKYRMFRIYCSSKKQSESCKKILSLYSAKYFVTESQAL